MSDNTSKEYKAGYDAAINGPNETNSHYSHFSTPEKTKEWEKGNKDGKEAIEIFKQKYTP